MTGRQWRTMTSTWQVRFRLAVQLPKKSSHLQSAGSKAAELVGSACRHPRGCAGTAGGNQTDGTGTDCLDSGELHTR